MANELIIKNGLISETSISSSTVSASSISLGSSVLDTAWTSYVPSWTSNGGTNPVIGNGTIQGYYKVIGKTCFVRGVVEMGSTTTFGTGEWLISMPLPAVAYDAIQLFGSILDNGIAWYNSQLNGGRAGFTDKTAIQFVNPVTGYADSISATQPFTWTTNDRFNWNGSYEIA